MRKTILAGILLLALGPTHALAIVVDVAIDDVTQAEGTGGTTDFTFTVSLTNGPLGGSSVEYSTVDGTATEADGDYTPVNGQLLEFGDFDLFKTVTITINPDAIFEPDQEFSVVLSNSVGLNIVDGTGVGKILNDDPNPSGVPAPATLALLGLGLLGVGYRRRRTR